MKFIYGTEDYLIQSALKKFLSDFNDEPRKYDESNSLEEILSEINTYSMFNDSKVIVISNHPILFDPKLGKQFLGEIKNSNLDGEEIVFIANKPLPKKSELIDFLLKEGNPQKIDAITSKKVPEIIRNIVSSENATITNRGVIMLTNLLPVNLRIIVSEVKKLLSQTRTITEDIIEKSIDKYEEDDYFALSNAIISNDKKRIVELYRHKKVMGETPISIIIQISNALKLSSEVQIYKNRGDSLKEIAEELNIHIYRIKKANELLINNDSGNVSNLIIKLANLDINIKRGLVDQEKGMDQFILELIK